jgi:hypothetical protein
LRIAGPGRQPTPIRPSTTPAANSTQTEVTTGLKGLAGPQTVEVELDVPYQRLDVSDDRRIGVCASDVKVCSAA